MPSKKSSAKKEKVSGASVIICYNIILFEF